MINAQEGFFDVESVWPKLEQALRQAISNLVAMRETEGSNIYGDFIKRADLIAEKLAVIEERSPQVVEEYQIRLSDRINELLAKHNQRSLNRNDCCRKSLFLLTVPVLLRRSSD